MPPKRTLRPLSDRKDGFCSFGVISGCDWLPGETRIEAMFEDGAGAFYNQHAFVAHTCLSSGKQTLSRIAKLFQGFGEHHHQYAAMSCFIV